METHSLAGIIEIVGARAQKAVRDSGVLGEDDGIIKYKVGQPSFLYGGYRALFPVDVVSSVGHHKVVVGCDVRFCAPDAWRVLPEDR